LNGFLAEASAAAMGDPVSGLGDRGSRSARLHLVPILRRDSVIHVKMGPERRL
jgi:hypothetical protein